MCAYAEYAVHASVVSHLALHSCPWDKAEKGRAALAPEAPPDSEKKNPDGPDDRQALQMTKQLGP